MTVSSPSSFVFIGMVYTASVVAGRGIS
ncbi:hypothetical protein A2U01_0061318 [Trifolium medium]|uniref:Uncharacterized protein n=1 Tax=Trifolium medium TaxID=97028 RepID=A0A392RWY4_9FABA|nr:hypothetical protein [Trifolium medium]